MSDDLEHTPPPPFVEPEPATTPSQTPVITPYVPPVSPPAPQIVPGDPPVMPEAPPPQEEQPPAAPPPLQGYVPSADPVDEPQGMGTWSFYDKTTGMFTGARFHGHSSLLSAQLALKGDNIDAHPGEVNHHNRKLDLDTGELKPHKPAPPWDGTDLTNWVWKWDKDAEEWRKVPRVSKLKADRWSDIKAERTRLTEQVISVNGIDFDANEVALQGLALQALRAAPGWTVQWTDAHNKVQVLSSQMALDLWDAFIARKAALHADSQQQRSQLAAATSDRIKDVGWQPPAEDPAAAALRERNKAIVASGDHIDP
jgi:hypothetical protein